VPPGARVFVLDAESRDETVRIAEAAGATVEVRAWTGFVDARRYALSRVATDWVLMLDADESLDPELAAAIEAIDGRAAGYRLRRITSLCGRPIRAAGWSNERIVRLFRRDRASIETRASGDVHERWRVSGELGDLPGSIVHDSYPTLASYHAKFARYTSIEAADLAPSFPAFAREVAIALARFPYGLLRYGGWRDGWRGIFVAFFSAVYPVTVRWKALRR
jgi:glycosyltransferase involved in cell wall biosynthesis